MEATVNAAKIYQFKAKDTEIKPYMLCLGNILKDFTNNNMKKTGLKGVVKVFFWCINTKDSFDTHRYLIKETLYKIMFGLIKKVFVGLLSGCKIKKFW